MTRDVRADAELAEIMDRLQSRQLSVDDGETLSTIPWTTVIADLRNRYPVVFQERVVGSKEEIGLCSSIRATAPAKNGAESPFVAADTVPLLENCVFLSSYHGKLSELTTIKSITVFPGRHADDFNIRMEAGIKLDRTPDGWSVKRLNDQQSELSTDFMQKRGWKLPLIFPHLPNSSS
jgi:hypothetical protein